MIEIENVQKAIEAEQFIIKVNRVHPPRGRMIDMKPSNNFIVLRQNSARISLAYVGRSYTSIHGISAINMTGEVVSKEILNAQKGAFNIKMKVRQNADVFTLHIDISKDGYASIKLSHPQIDNIRYSGKLSLL